MKRFTLIYSFLLAVALPLLIACTNDDVTTVDDPTQQDGKIKVHLRVSQAAPAITRAEEGSKWKDPNATDDEMMNVWTVVAVYEKDEKANKVAAIYACKPSGDPDQEIDDFIDDTVELPEAGKYRFYSFANMSPAKVMELLKISSPASAADPEILANDFKGIENNIIKKIAFSEASVIATAENNIPVQVKGNGFDPTSDNNGFDAKGIPMSNVQTGITVADENSIELIVIRMLAKIKLQITNESGSPMTIKSIRLTNITANANTVETSDNNNLMLLPKLTSGQNTMESTDGYHGDIQPNLNGIPSQMDVEVLNENESIVNGSTKEFTFYVNESDVRKSSPTGSNITRAKEVVPVQKPTDNPNYNPDFYRFFLKITIDKGENEEELRYALIDDNGTKDGEKWDYIARNDYRIIPIVLDDYKLDMIPYDFPAIGVSPASVKEEDGIYTINFHDYGHFHLVPQVTKYSSPATVVPYGEQSSTGDYWTLYGGSFGTAWGTWTDASKTSYSGDFYRTTVVGSADGDEAGGVPVWYKNDGSDGPKWSPNNDDKYPPFIFGYINKHPNPDPNGSDRKVYHEFSINLYKGDTTPRQMTYRLYMILDADQMLRSRGLGASAPRHTHHSH